MGKMRMEYAVEVYCHIFLYNRNCGIVLECTEFGSDHVDQVDNNY